MILGEVTDDFVPQVSLEVAEKTWAATIDSGFNGDLELPVALKDALNARSVGDVRSSLAGGQFVVEECFQVEFPFDGENVTAFATFVDARELLIGARLLKDHRLQIDFPQRSVLIERTSD